MKNKVDQNLREFTRIPINVMVEINDGESTFKVKKTIDLSMKGISVQADHTLPVDTKCAVSILLGNGDMGVSIDVQGKVKRSSGSDMAIEFTEIDLDSYEYLQNLVMHNAHSFHDTVEEEIHNHLGLKKKP